MREIREKFAVVIGVLYVAFVAWSLYGAVFPVETHTFRMVHLAFIFGLAFPVHPLARKAERWAWWLDLCLAVLGVAAVVYALGDLDQFIRRSQGRCRPLSDGWTLFRPGTRQTLQAVGASRRRDR